MISGALPASMMPPSGALAMRSACPAAKPAPGVSQRARKTPIQAAAKVVTTMKAASRRPTLFRAAPDSAPVSPPMIEVKTSGTSTMAIRPRKTCPGKASQLPRISAVRGSRSPTPGPKSAPKATPSTMPTMTCAQSRVRIQARSL